MRRIVVGAVLLLSCVAATAQVKPRESIFTGHPAAEDLPPFLLRLQNSPAIASNESFKEYLLACGNRGPLLPGEEDSTKDSVRMQGTAAAQDTALPAKSPGLAILLSAVVPGSGQIYVHRYITIPLIWGFGYYFTSAWITQNKRYEQYRDLFAASVKADSSGKGDNTLQSIRDFYRDDRDKFAFYIAITYVLNIIDAYVGASLYSFDVSDNLGGSAALRIRSPIR